MYTPDHYEIRNKVTHFWYKPEHWKEFHRIGKRNGNNGTLLIRREGKMLTYRGYGTIEHPRKEWIDITLHHNKIFDGELQSDDQMLIPRKSFFESEFEKGNIRFVMLDFSKHQGGSNVELLRGKN